MLLMSLIMTCCDLSDQVRSWPTSQNVAVKWIVLQKKKFPSYLSFPLYETESRLFGIFCSRRFGKANGTGTESNDGSSECLHTGTTIGIYWHSCTADIWNSEQSVSTDISFFDKHRWQQETLGSNTNDIYQLRWKWFAASKSTS